jgi:hypothetical protein
LNLFWLKYVSYALLAGAAFFYFAIRLNRLAVSRGRKAILYVACIVMACMTWHVQETNAQQHSPRKLVVGTVAQLRTTHHRSGNIEDRFRLEVGRGSLSPEFSADLGAENAVGQPIHPGDLLGVLYRTWDGIPLTIDEIEGQSAGWHYTRYSDGGAYYIMGVSIGGLAGLVSALLSTRNQRPRAPEPATRLNLND